MKTLLSIVLYNTRHAAQRIVKAYLRLSVVPAGIVLLDNHRRSTVSQGLFNIFSKEFSMLRFKFFNAFTVLLILLQAVAPIPALAMAGTDLPDYTPGSVVTFSGDNSNDSGYLPDEI